MEGKFMYVAGLSVNNSSGTSFKPHCNTQPTKVYFDGTYYFKVDKKDKVKGHFNFLIWGMEAFDTLEEAEAYYNKKKELFIKVVQGKVDRLQNSVDRFKETNKWS